MTRSITMIEALNEALNEEMERDEHVLMIGEDIADSGGLFQVSEGLLDKFGQARVIDSPISEAAIAGFGVGAAIVGSRPVIEFQIFDFVTLAMDQIVNHAAKWRYMSGGQVKIPLVLRGPTLTGVGTAAQHSQAQPAWFVNTPGLIVVAPSTPADAKGLLKAAIREDNPVIFVEKRTLYEVKGDVPDGEHIVELGKARICREGTDVTLVGVLGGVQIAERAAARLERDGISAEVIDPRTLKPLDVDTIAASLERTNRLVVVSEDPRANGVASEIVSQMIDAAFWSLDAPPVRVTGADTPIPYAASLERAVLPSVDETVLKVKELFA
ncbi:MAG TPA: alpha-ketoacid dehydrogenase subunit beta [Capillimicrobium sp.]|nr:alpha-ketoacid dehydrogenase subunit beta [Capillimicrobium sp.]